MQRAEIEQTKSKSLRRGALVFLALAILTGIEYLVSSAWNAYFPLLLLLALIKAGLIVFFFMHVLQLRERGAGEK